MMEVTLSPTFVLPAWTLLKREIVRFYRQRSRVIGALASPLVFWVLIGSGLGTSFRSPSMPEGMNYLEYFFPGTLALILLFTAIFSTISIIEDRKEGFLQSVLVAPVRPSAIVMGKVLGGTVLAMMQGIVLLALGPVIGVPMGWIETGLALVMMCALAFALTGLGFMIAWRLDSTQGFHAIMNLFLVPMWLLSGALFPLSGASVWVRAIMWINPMTYGVWGLRQALYRSEVSALAGAPPLVVCFMVTLVFGAAMFALSMWMTNRRRGEGSR
jgi:ABC-2 type transport system permease protein